MTKEELVEKFLCPGCVCGSDTKCGSYKPNRASEPWIQCDGHVLGTMIMPMPGTIALGMPKGFNRPGYCVNSKSSHSQMLIRLWPKGTKPDWDVFNVPVWALEQDGFLFVRTALPRTGNFFVDVIEGRKASKLCPEAKNVTKMYDEFD